jgi:Ice-binding-like
MKSISKYFSACLVGLLSQAAFAQAPALGAASGFEVLGGTAVTCTTSVIAGDVGISPGSAFTNTGCMIAGGMPPATNVAAAAARNDFIIAYAALQARACDFTLGSTIPVSTTLPPGVYCTGAALTATGVTLTLDAGGDANAVWIFKIGTSATGALTGTDFSVAMAGGGQACNVFWAPSAAATMTTSSLKGSILAGNATGGSITMTGGTLVGRALARVAVTMTNASVIGCDIAAGPPKSCKPHKHHHKHGKDKGHGDHDDDDDDRDHHDKDHGDKHHDKDRDDKHHSSGSKKGK